MANLFLVRASLRGRELAVLETMDGGKPIKESRDIDLPLVAAHFFYHAGWADKLQYAFPGRNPVMESFEKLDVSQLPPDIADIMGEVKKIKTDPAAYKAALLDWVDKVDPSQPKY